MMNTMNFETMEIDFLAQECSNETKKYYRGEAHESRYCFELLSRAYRDHNEAALGRAHAIYLPMLASHAQKQPIFYRSCQDADSFARTALANFYHAVKGEKFLQKFTVLPEAIAYMNRCVVTAILEDVRSDPPSVAPQSEDIPSPVVPSSMELEELWAYICSRLPDPNDQQLARCRFVLEMKPAEIVKYYPHLWKTPREVSVALQNIRRRLRADPYLRGIAGGKDESDETDD
jgi:hypothetical protein